MTKIPVAAMLVVTLAVAARAAFQSAATVADAQKLFDAGKYQEVVNTLPSQTIDNLSSQDRPKAYLLLGQSRARNEDADGALGVLQLGVQLYPKDINLLSALADLLHSQELDDRAKPLYERVLRIHPNNSSAHLGLAEIEHSQGFLERSVRHYEQSLVEFSKNPAIWRSFAGVLSERRDYPKAVAAIEKSLSLEPNDALSLESLALFQYRQGLRREADETIRRAIAAAPLPPKLTELRLERALWLLSGGQLDASLREAQDSLRDDPENPLAYWIRASVALRRGDRQAAARDLRQAGSKPSQYPFIASISGAMLKQVEETP